MSAKTKTAFPNIDPRVHCVGVSALRKMSAEMLANIDDDLYLLQDGEQPLAVIVVLRLLYELCEQLLKEADKAVKNG